MNLASSEYQLTLPKVAFRLSYKLETQLWPILLRLCRLNLRNLPRCSPRRRPFVSICRPNPPPRRPSRFPPLRLWLPRLRRLPRLSREARLLRPRLPLLRQVPRPVPLLRLPAPRRAQRPFRVPCLRRRRSGWSTRFWPLARPSSRSPPWCGSRCLVRLRSYRRVVRCAGNNS